MRKKLKGNRIKRFFYKLSNTDLHVTFFSGLPDYMFTVAIIPRNLFKLKFNRYYRTDFELIISVLKLELQSA